MSQIRNVEHVPQAFISLGWAEVMLADHRPLKKKEETPHVFIASIAWRKDQFAGLPALEVVLKTDESVRTVVCARPRSAR